jgi:hypothetical protein
MATAIDRIRSKNRRQATSNVERPAASNTTPPADHMEQRRITADAKDAGDVSTLPPPLPCLICSCPAIWSTIYEPTAFRCADCEPPPGGWHWLTGGWSFVGRRLMLAVDLVDASTAPAGEQTGEQLERWWWESFPRIDWRKFRI